MNDTRIRGIVATDLFDYGPQRSRLLVRMWRALAAGRPIGPGAIETLAAQSGIDLGEAVEFLAAVSERDDQGRIAGILGLSLNPHPHRFIVGGVPLATWCAIDTLFLPAMLGAPATVESESPASGRPVRLEVAPDVIRRVTPASTAVSLPVVHADEVDTSSTQGIWSAFCHRIFFFADHTEGGAWIRGRGEMEVVSVEAARRHAAETWSKVLLHARALDAVSAVEGR